ncbi:MULTISPECIES: phospho-N-acetylmuramoyl-pentapeptide-transferase [Candidatus Ichthyocystis]|uniref:phospho-N-acetylmuramoyl-pentapeptide- transferase n=1 Tax=Candidatus Ichthyocystis TaxID=2929841 RepID=UPI000A4E7382|nr:MULTISPECIES: phospho-N-acetylmuramoyl-pentapeptide-transferase [Ichthyocystis]
MLVLPSPFWDSTLFFRGFASFLTSFLAVIIWGKPFVNFLRKHKMTQSIRRSGPASHYSKDGTPTMGGVLIILFVTLSCFLWSDLSNVFVRLLLFVLWSFGLIGFWDDYKKMKFNQGISAVQKYLAQSFLAVAVIGLIFFLSRKLPTNIFAYFYIPYGGFFKYPGNVVGFCVLSYFVLVGSANAVNLADGLDGLAIVLVIFATLFFAILSGTVNYFHTVQLDFLSFVGGLNELLVFCTALMGASLGFLWFNAYPARIFMGDIGSLSVGATIGTMAIIFRQEVIFFILSMVFVCETLSVIIQFISRRLFNRKVFLMAPFHHHFELSGLHESTVVVRFWIIASIFLVLSLFLFFNS